MARHFDIFKQESEINLLQNFLFAIFSRFLLRKKSAKLKKFGADFIKWSQYEKG